MKNIATNNTKNYGKIPTKNLPEKEKSKTKLDANFDKTEFYLLSLRHILEKEKIYNNLNDKIYI